MSLEIKELIVKFSVEDKSVQNHILNTELTDSDIKDIVERCTDKVLEKFQRLTER